MKQFAVLLTVVTLVAGCVSSREFKPLEFPEPTPLQDPLPGQAIVYFLRTPNDSGLVQLTVNGNQVASLSSRTYTALSLTPGRYSFATFPENSRDQSGMHIQAAVVLAANERRFFYNSVQIDSGISFSILSLGKTGIVPIFTPSSAPSGPRKWVECTELDAQGFLTNAKPVLPAQSSL